MEERGIDREQARSRKRGRPPKHDVMVACGRCGADFVLRIYRKEPSGVRAVCCPSCGEVYRIADMCYGKIKTGQRLVT